MNDIELMKKLSDDYSDLKDKYFTLKGNYKNLQNENKALIARIKPIETFDLLLAENEKLTQLVREQEELQREDALTQYIYYLETLLASKKIKYKKQGNLNPYVKLSTFTKLQTAFQEVKAKLDSKLLQEKIKEHQTKEEQELL